MNSNKNTLKNKTFNKRNMSGWILVLPTIIMFIYTVWHPLIVGITDSFCSMKGFTPTGFVGLKNYAEVVTDTNFAQTFKNTLLYVLWALIIAFPLPFICAVIVNEVRFGQTLFKVLLYLPCVIPAIAVFLLWKFVYLENEGGLLNMIRFFFGMAPRQWLGDERIVILCIIVSVAWRSIGTGMIMYLASLQSINKELYEAARIDGAGFWGRVKHVLIPHMWGLLLLMAVREMIGVFQITAQPMTMTGGGPNGASTSLGYLMYQYAFQFGQVDRSLAVGVIMFITLMLLTVVYFKLDKKINE